MKAVLCKKYGELEDLVVEDVAPLSPSSTQVVVSVKAAGINFADALVVQGKYQFKPTFPFSPGIECAGVVREVGTGVSEYRPGDRVLAHSSSFGAIAQELATDAGLVFRIPDQMDFNTAAGFFVACGTSHHALVDRARLQSGETLLVLGAAGGVGLTAVEIGKAMGARVIAAASTDEKLELCRKFGADDGINYSSQDLREAITHLTAGRGVDVVYDPVGGGFAEPCIRSLAPAGRFLVVGFAAGEIPKIALNLVLVKRSAIVGVYYGDWVANNRDAARAGMQQLFDWYLAGKIKPYISRTFPMSRTAEALRRVMSRSSHGKLVIEM